ncbi:hypothetical protein R3P38DRAFT_2867504 [Favolaschia claudopus]|uniref:NAD(P)-binding protein n=1 Tax=Favolaschia claudopus TaxID=2862362 RepID=A0AAW0D8W4_9AGAR
MSTEQIVLVVGASRGIGLSLVEQLAARPDTTAIGTARGSCPALEAINPKIKILTLDLLDEESIQKAASAIPELDTLIVNGAVGARDPVTITSTEKLSEYLNANVLGPHRVIRAFLPALRARKTRRIVGISSAGGSLVRQAHPAAVGLMGCYSTSKAAFNMMLVQFHNELQKEEEEEEPRWTVVALHPGFVATDMGKNPHLLKLAETAGMVGMPPAESAKGILKVVDGLDYTKSASFLDWKGDVVPW